MQEAFDLAYKYLCENFEEQKYIWDVKQIKRWGRSEASEKQKTIIKRICKDLDVSELTKSQASQILNRLFYQKVR
jgi:hypothetical protein